MSGALARHDQLLRHSIGAHGGHVFKTVGDAFCAAFHTASDGLAAALEAQRALHLERWPEPVKLRVRMALHTGAVEVRDGDYFGGPLNRVARMLAARNGGQTLLSEATHHLCRDHLPPLATSRGVLTRRSSRLRWSRIPSCIYPIWRWRGTPWDKRPKRMLRCPS